MTKNKILVLFYDNSDSVSSEKYGSGRVFTDDALVTLAEKLSSKIAKLENELEFVNKINGEIHDLKRESRRIGAEITSTAIAK